MSKLIVGNWKLNPISIEESVTLVERIDFSSLHETVFCPPPAFLSLFANHPNLGAQNCFWKSKGAYTGQVSTQSLSSIGVKYCIVGHSELRGLGETNEQTNWKIKALLEVGIVPILCIGYGTTPDEDDLAVVDTLNPQLEVGLAEADPAQVVVAYEPVWAISNNGIGKSADPEHAEKISLMIKTKYGVDKVLYGGSINSTNCQPFLSQPNIDGLLVGGASLLADDFNKIINTQI